MTSDDERETRLSRLHRIGGRIEVFRSRSFTLLCVALVISSSASAEPIAASFRIQSDWGTGYVGEIQLSNAGQTPISGWSIEFDLGGQLVSLWNGDDTVTGAHYVVRDLGWNADLAP